MTQPMSSRKLLWGTALALAASTGMLLGLVLPEFDRFKTLRTNTQAVLMKSTTAMPDATSLTPSHWQAWVIQPLTDSVAKTGVVVNHVEADPAHPQTETGWPIPVQQIPVTVDLTGSYSALRRYMDDLIARFPSARIRHVVFTTQEKTPLPPNQSPALHGEIGLELLISP